MRNAATGRQAWCTYCQKWKPVEDFSPKSYHEDGSYATVVSRCKRCLAYLNRLRRREDPAWAKQNDRRNWERIKANPDQLECRRQLTKENVAVYWERRGGRSGGDRAA